MSSTQRFWYGFTSSCSKCQTMKVPCAYWSSIIVLEMPDGKCSLRSNSRKGCTRLTGNGRGLRSCCKNCSKKSWRSVDLRCVGCGRKWKRSLCTLGAALRLRFKFKRKFKRKWSHRLSLFYIVLDLQYFNNLSVKLKFKNFGFIFYYVECKQDLHLYFAAGRIQVLKIIHFICLLCCVIASSCYFISLYAVLLWPVFFWVL